ncbi:MULTISPECIES: response regulator transcription factor [Stenotrophomonas]|uniref:Response regulator transcription factor n=1 Tax=Stenotrophomonas bentonitica TaxID=1450134 RepID=A0ABU9JQK3_9GAMM|nr:MULTISPECIES: response regulator transcription factor [Stenotrophomonas]
MKRIVIADDHPVVRTGLQSILSRDPRFEVIGEAADPEQLEELLATRACELLITDLSMPWSRRPDGVRMLAAICRDYPGLPILVITAFSNEQILRAVAKLGVSGILDKTSALPVLIEAVDAALAGERYFAPVLEQRLRCKVQRGAGLTARESEVVRLLAHGLSVKDVADIHRRTISTISRQKGAAMRRLGLHSDYALLDYAQSVGLSPGGGPGGERCSLASIGNLPLGRRTPSRKS